MSDDGLEHLKGLKKTADQKAADAKANADRDDETRRQMKTQANSDWVVLGKTLQAIVSRYNGASGETNVAAEFRSVAGNPNSMPDYSVILKHTSQQRVILVTFNLSHDLTAQYKVDRGQGISNPRVSKPYQFIATDSPTLIKTLDGLAAHIIG